MEIKNKVLPISSKLLKWIKLIPSASALALEGWLQGWIQVSVAAACVCREEAGQDSAAGRNGSCSEGLAPRRAPGTPRGKGSLAVVWRRTHIAFPE